MHLLAPARAGSFPRMLTSLATLSAVLRLALLAGAALMTAIAAADWAVRTRRVSPFSGIARFTRSRVDPRLAGIERMVVRAGGHQSATPWWAVLAYVVLALLVLALVDLLLSLAGELAVAVSGGALGLVWLAVHWAFGLLIVALIVRVATSWFPQLAGRWWAAWSYGATDWMLRPLRRMLPSVGPIDMSPLVAYFGLVLARWLVETALGGLR